MNIVIVGGGKVGRKLVEDFNNEDCDIVLIDIKKTVCEYIEETFDVRSINGSGTDVDVLLEADMKKTDLFIAVTANDEYNALCSIMAKKMGAQRCVARVRNREYSKHVDFMRDALGINMIINPELATAGEISRILRFPAATKTETFARGRIELIEFTVNNDSALCNMAIYEIYKKYKIKVLICAVQRGGDVLIPNGDFVIHGEDRLHITASHGDLTRFMREIGIIQKKVKTVMLIGGGRISLYLAKMLIDSGMRVKIIEINPPRCGTLSEFIPKADIICGDGTDRHILEEEGIDRVDAIVSLTGIDEENMIISMYAQKKGVDKVIAKVDRLSFDDLIEETDVFSIVTPKNITANMIIRYARAMQSARDTEMRTLYRIVNNRAEAMEFIVNQESALTGRPLARISIADGVLIAAILRNNRVLVPDGGSTLEVGDTVIVVTTHRIKNLTDILA